MLPSPMTVSGGPKSYTTTEKVKPYVNFFMFERNQRYSLAKFTLNKNVTLTLNPPPPPLPPPPRPPPRPPKPLPPPPRPPRPPRKLIVSTAQTQEKRFLEVFFQHVEKQAAAQLCVCFDASIDFYVSCTDRRRLCFFQRPVCWADSVFSKSKQKP